jgi:transitional endoplasmic reticulum ATPase
LSGLTALLLRREGILSVLARLYPDEVSARPLLEPLGADLARLPVPRSGGTRLTWWYDICRAVEDGAFTFQLDALLAAVLEDYPGQPALRRFLAAQETSAAQEESVAFAIPGVTFDDIAGYEPVKALLRRALGLLSGADPLPASMAAVRQELLPRGFLLHGPGGTGKALFARAVAHEIGATVHALSAGEVLDKYVGESERRMREAFAVARANAPAVIVFDEFDSIAGRHPDPRSVGLNNGVVAQILHELSDWHPGGPVLFVGITNRIDVISTSLLRPGRLHPVHVALPTHADRRQILRHFARRYEVDLDESLIDLMGAATEGCSGDDVRAVMREACLDRLSGTEITPTHLGILVGRHLTRRRELHR